jgi:hypothetical protein
MKKIIASAIVLSACYTSASFAAYDVYLSIKGTKGATQTVQCPSGVCTISSLAADTYSVSMVDASGKPISLDNAKYECTVKSPRDAASGLATGKRMHKPLVITKELDSAVLAVTEPETNLTVACVASGEAAVSSAATEATTAVKPTYDVKAVKK